MSKETLQEYRLHLQIMRLSCHLEKHSCGLEKESSDQGHGAIFETIKTFLHLMKWEHIWRYHKSKYRFTRFEITEENLWCIDLRHMTERYAIRVGNTVWWQGGLSRCLD